MNQALFQWILRQVKSAEYSTEVAGEYGKEGISFRLTHRNSPYKSHQGVMFGESESSFRGLWIRARGSQGEGFGILSHEPPDSWLSSEPHLEVRVERVPDCIVRGLLLRIANETGLPVDCDSVASRWAYVVVRRQKLLGFDEEGRPEFATRQPSQPLKLRPLPVEEGFSGLTLEEPIELDIDDSVVDLSLSPQ